MMILYLVRHAHSVFTPDERGRPLSKDGLEAAKNVALQLKTEKIDTFFQALILGRSRRFKLLLMSKIVLFKQ